ncbi:unnamed protein product [Phytophthora lilii]|uniref:Unnamed protein product n=1 Tax=Phytophthora lilii TaxID=2077276 RepID=A0A9W6XHI6_9STRA|nr:unnamed protein product [Phytophthora lilii]
MVNFLVQEISVDVVFIDFVCGSDDLKTLLESRSEKVNTSNSESTLIWTPMESTVQVLKNLPSSSVALMGLPFSGGHSAVVIAKGLRMPNSNRKKVRIAAPAHPVWHCGENTEKMKNGTSPRCLSRTELGAVCYLLVTCYPRIVEREIKAFVYTKTLWSR